MSVISESTQEVHYFRRQINVEGEAPVDVPEKHWAYKGRQYSPLQLNYRYEAGSKKLTEVTVKGYILGKDGSETSKMIDLTYLNRYSGSWNYPAPEWIQRFLDAEGCK